MISLCTPYPVFMLAWPVQSATGASGVSVPLTGVSEGLSLSRLGENDVGPENQLLADWGRHE